MQTWGYLRAVRGSSELGDFGKRHFEKMNRLSIEVRVRVRVRARIRAGARRHFEKRNRLSIEVRVRVRVGVRVRFGLGLGAALER